MNDKLESAIKAIETSRLVFRKAEEEAIKTMKFVLEKAGENGVDLCPGDFTDDLYVAVAEIEASIFEPVASKLARSNQYGVYPRYFAQLAIAIEIR